MKKVILLAPKAIVPVIGILDCMSSLYYAYSYHGVVYQMVYHDCGFDPHFQFVIVNKAGIWSSDQKKFKNFACAITYGIKSAEEYNSTLYQFETYKEFVDWSLKQKEGN